MSGYGSTGTSNPLEKSGASDGTHRATSPLPGETTEQNVGQAATRKQRTSITYGAPEGHANSDRTRHISKRSDVESQAGDLFSLEDDAIPSEHCHVIEDDLPKLDKKARCKLVTASVLCLIFMTAEIVGGVLANSLALATDAAHLLTDFASFMISLFAIYLAARPATKQMSFGWHRAEVMGALISVLFIWVVTGILVYMAAERVMSGDYEIDAMVMLIIAAIGIGFNIIMLATLHDTHGHSHSHGHSHGGVTGKPSQKLAKNPDAFKVSVETSNGNYSPEGSVVYNCVDSEEVKLLDSSESDFSGDNRTNINVRAAFIHVLGDLLQSAGVFVAALIIYFKPEYKLADPICTFLFSVLVLFTTITILRDTLNVLMEGAPRGVSFSEVKDSLSSIPGVLELHNLRLWSLTTSRTAVAVHLAVAKDSDHQKISKKAGALLREKFGINECTVQTEQFVDAMRDCTQCQHPVD